MRKHRWLRRRHWMNQNHTMYSSSGKSFYFLLFTITEKWYIYVWHIHLESPTSALFSIITAQIMASNLTVQNFFDSDLPEFDDKSITTPARSDTDGATQLEEAQNVITDMYQCVPRIIANWKPENLHKHGPLKLFQRSKSSRNPRATLGGMGHVLWSSRPISCPSRRETLYQTNRQRGMSARTQPLNRMLCT